MTTIATRRLNSDTYQKTEAYLQQAGIAEENNSFYHVLQLQGGADDGQYLYALIQLSENKISIKEIFVLEYDPKQGTYDLRSSCSEKGNYAKILSEKYLNRFFDDLETIDINNNKERQNLLTAERTQEVEAEIDQCIDPARITPTEINAYNRIELTAPAEEAARWFCKEYGEADYSVIYNREAKIFMIYLYTSEINIKVSLSDVVHRKWKDDECFSKALISCICDLVLAA